MGVFSSSAIQGLLAIHHDDQEEEANAFLDLIEKNTSAMRRGASLTEGMIRVDAELPYHKSLLPHWKEFASAIEQHQHAIKCLPKGEKSRISLVRMDLPDVVTDSLSKALHSTHFHQFFFLRNNLGSSGINFALKYAESNPILEQFFLDFNRIDSKNDFDRLCKIIECHPAIDMIGLAGCRGDLVGYDMLQSILTAGVSKLKYINLSSNDISTKGGVFLSDFLANNPILGRLNVQHNKLDDNDAMMLASALSKNTNMRDLELTGNLLTDAGWALLLKAIFDNTSLNSASDSNHICRIDYPEYEAEIDGFLFDNRMNGAIDSGNDFSAAPARQKKIYSILSFRNSKGSNVQHFDDVPVEFLPDMLGSIQQYSKYHLEDTAPIQGNNDVKPLSLVYEIMRRWDKSLSVYESLCVR